MTLREILKEYDAGFSAIYEKASKIANSHGELTRAQIEPLRKEFKEFKEGFLKQYSQQLEN